MAWKIEFDPAAAKELDKLDGQIVKRVLKFLYERVARLDDPRSIGEALGRPARRILEVPGRRPPHYCSHRDGRLTILVLKVGNRRDVYK